MLVISILNNTGCLKKQKLRTESLGISLLLIVSKTKLEHILVKILQVCLSGMIYCMFHFKMHTLMTSVKVWRFLNDHLHGRYTCVSSME